MNISWKHIELIKSDSKTFIVLQKIISIHHIVLKKASQFPEENLN